MAYNTFTRVDYLYLLLEGFKFPAEKRLTSSLDGHWTTRQTLFVIREVYWFYLSYNACKDLAIIPPSYPLPLDLVSSAQKHNPSVASIQETFIERQSPPSKISKLPYPPTPDNIPKLQQHLLDAFFSSTFNKSKPFPTLSTCSPMLSHMHVIHLLLFPTIGKPKLKLAWMLMWRLVS